MVKKRNDYQKKYHKKRYNSDKVYKRKFILRIAIANTLAVYNKRPIAKGITYTTKELIAHIENQFQEGMNWKNYGTVWEIDHIRPLKTATTIEEVYKLFQLSNLRPLFRKVNRNSNFL